MATYTEQLQDVWHAFEEHFGNMPETARKAVEWGVDQGLIALPTIDPVDKLSHDMARALRDEVSYDEHGRPYRRNHALRVLRNGVQMTIWATMENAPREYMAESVAQRRRQIVGDCVQLAIDVAAYNGKHPDQEPLQLSFDFTADVLMNAAEQNQAA